MLGRATTDHIEAIDFRRVFAELPAPVALISLAGGSWRIMAASAGFCGELRTPRTAIEGRRVADVFRAGAADIRRIVARSLESGLAAQTQITHALGDRVVRLEAEARPLGAGVCLTVHVLAPRPTLAQVGQGAMLSEIAPLLGGLVFVHDLENRRLGYGAHDLVGELDLPPGSIEARAFAARVHPADRTALRRHVEATGRLADKVVTDTCVRLKARDGRWLWFAIRSRVLERDDGGRVRRAVGVARDVTRDRETARALVDASLRLAHAELNERRRVGRELHDSTSQQLVAARLGLAALERSVELRGEPRQILGTVRRALAAAQGEIRNFSYLLHPPALDDGLPAALKDFGAGFALRTGLGVSVSVGEGPWDLSELMEVSLFRVSQEALMNVYRHARARRAMVRLHRDDHTVTLEIEDDGIGLPRSKTATPAVRLGVGVSGMQARMTQLSGSLELAACGGGLTVRARAPIPVPEPAAG